MPSPPRSARWRPGPVRCRCCRACGVTGHGRRLELVGTDLELTIRVRVPADARGRGQRGRPGAVVLGDRAQARRRHGDGRVRRRRRPDRGRPLRDDVAHTVGIGVPVEQRKLPLVQRQTVEALQPHDPGEPGREILELGNAPNSFGCLIASMMSGFFFMSSTSRPTDRREKLNRVALS